MSAKRLLLYGLGSALAIGGLVLLFFETGLSNWVPSGIAVAGLIIMVGVAVIGMSNKARKEMRVDEHHEHHGHHDP